MSDEGNREPADDRPEHDMTDDTDEPTQIDDEPEQRETDDEDAGQAEDARQAEDDPQAEEEPERRIDGDLRRKLNYGLLLGLGLLAMIAVIQFYLNMGSVINQWVTHEYRSLFQAVFNLVVLLVVGAAISWQVKRLAD